VICNTVDEFICEIADREMPLSARPQPMTCTVDVVHARQQLSSFGLTARPPARRGVVR
jgi:hypothetical protein